ncbi:glucose 1-dehydrogenase [Agrobacterium vitis]|uniref:SDR family oxidoreductase n=1 Tax=Agrobacterium vitis TaxID=373 RepID=A0AAE4X176_AGRVI|nr:SDR family oxidoreductase [Agrobacterium vitis]MBF2714147.1 SDR family oxidoreductase [Agrobacterium vitis]MUO81526.1 glucose 1-dehydrogenase [Agrobacterium vitis]MUO95827.1 glucose 1-dehydrogenase [Agrobacterium vitis]MVA93906.1 glucose 1-dehydrogenase [Agrobacterium vitis]MVB03587.1 glucose 1-dehydrogenase [Agrobacterium vitis]
MAVANELFDLTGKVALVTGAHRGIGFAIAEELAKAGARVAICSNDQQAVAQAANTLRERGHDVRGFCCDVSSNPALDDLVSATRKAFGRIDILVCNAGIAPHFGPMATASDEEYDATMRVNLYSAMQLANCVIPEMVERQDGVVIFTSSIAGLRGNGKLGVYALSKAAIAQLARNLAVEHGPDNVRVNAISPGLTKTEFATPILSNEEGLKVRLGKTPLRRAADPREIAGAAVFLSAAAGGFITGHNLVIDGGTMISD